MSHERALAETPVSAFYNDWKYNGTSCRDEELLKNESSHLTCLNERKREKKTMVTSTYKNVIILTVCL